MMVAHKEIFPLDTGLKNPDSRPIRFADGTLALAGWGALIRGNWAVDRDGQPVLFNTEQEGNEYLLQQERLFGP